MIELRFHEENKPLYMTNLSAGADLRSRTDIQLLPGERKIVPTGVWIASFNLDDPNLPKNCIPELQIRARSGLALKRGLTMVNGIGTIDLDYKDEICALMINLSPDVQEIKSGDRIAQLVLNFVMQIPGLDKGGERSGGMGSTGV